MSESADRYRHLLVFKRTDDTRQIKKLQRFFERDRFDRLTFHQRRETRLGRLLVVRIRLPDLNNRTVTADFDENRLPALRVDTELTLPDLMFCFHHSCFFYNRMEEPVEFIED